MKDFIKILLVEDDPDWIQAIQGYLQQEPDFMLAGAASNRAEALALADALEIDVVLMDIQLAEGELSGIEVAAEILQRKSVKVIMLTSVSSEDMIRKAFTAGAVQYVLKNDFDQLPHLIRLVHRQPLAMDVLLKEFSRLKREEQLNPLTPAEREVFEMMEQGLTVPEMEKKLVKSESTLKNQINRILKKLNASSRKEAVDKVNRKGL
ncbi:response regulator transcription factor [Marinicrinis lubricantis]|uniref:Response regulator n=1 Tax=Marinicrinis lubricantis TaxID=2086470 RepID=A0ABW1IM44_9BACL